MMATTMRTRMMTTTTKMETKMTALKRTSRLKAAQAKRRAEVHQQASRLLQQAQPSFFRLPHHSLLNRFCILQQNPPWALGNSPPSKVQIL